MAQKKYYWNLCTSPPNSEQWIYGEAPSDGILPIMIRPPPGIPPGPTDELNAPSPSPLNGNYFYGDSIWDKTEASATDEILGVDWYQCLGDSDIDSSGPDSSANVSGTSDAALTG